MFDIEDLQLLALNTPSPLAQRVIKDSCGLNSWLTLNPHLTQELWLELWADFGGWEGIKDSATYAPGMLRSAPTLELKKLLLTASGSVIAEYLRQGCVPEINPTPKKLLNQLLDPTLYPDEEIAAALIISGELTDSQLRTQWERVYNALEDPTLRKADVDDEFYAELICETLLAVANHYPSITDEELVMMMQPLAYGLSEVTKVMVDTRPSVINAMLANKEASYFIETIATSRHLREPQGTKIFELAVKNYSGSQGPLIGDIFAHGFARAALENLAENYAMPHELRLKAYNTLAGTSEKSYAYYAKAIQAEQAAVAQNLPPLTIPWEELEGAELQALKDLQGEIGFWDYPSLLGSHKFNTSDHSFGYETFNREYVINELSPKLDTLGVTAWELFIAMLDEWSSTIENLLEVVSSTSQK